MIYDIAVVTQFVGNDYCDEIIRGIKEFYATRPVRLSILEVRTPEARSSDYEYQYWAALSLTQARSFKAVILISGTFCSDMTSETIVRTMESYFNCPVISVSVDLPFKNSYITQADCLSGIRELLNHIINEHGRKRIGMITSGQTNSDEGQKRFEAYKTVLAENNIPYDESIVFHSNFSQHGTVNVLREKIKSKADIKFDALFCANDFSGFGAVQFLQELGLKIPSDIIIAGYDDCSQAAKVVVPLTTINQNVNHQGYKAAELAYQIACGEKPERLLKVPVRPVYRESCGCRSVDLNSANFVGNVQTEAQKYFDNASYNISYFSLLDKIQSSQTLSEMYSLILRIFSEVNLWDFALCLYKTPIYVGRGEKFVLPEEVELAMAFELQQDYKIINPGLTFNPYESILPEGILDIRSNDFIVNSIFFGEKQYGYMMYKPGERTPTFYAVYMKIVSNAIARSYDFTKSLETQIKLEQENKILQQNNSELNAASKTDELTQLYNRRGFLFLGQQSINLALQMNSNGLVIFGDMDGLKQINDNYGHDAGDIAIKAEAEILSKAFRQNDIIGRLGGDEFAIVASGMTLSAIKTKKKDISEMCEKWNTETHYPFKLSISLGAAEFNKDSFILQDLLSLADNSQYEEKKAKHAARE